MHRPIKVESVWDSPAEYSGAVYNLRIALKKESPDIELGAHWMYINRLDVAMQHGYRLLIPCKSFNGRTFFVCANPRR